MGRPLLTFLQLADIHLLDEADIAYPQKVVEAMNAQGGEFALVCGDLATDGKREELELAKHVLDGLQMPYYPVIGNHDAMYPGDRDEWLFKEVFGLESNSYVFVESGVYFIGWDSGVGTDMDAPAKPHAIDRLREAVAEIPIDAPIVMFTHYPFAKGVVFETPNADEVLSAFAGRRLLAVISAHYHCNTEIIQDGILMTTTVVSSGSRDNSSFAPADEKGFRAFTISDALEISTKFVSVPIA